MFLIVSFMLTMAIYHLIGDLNFTVDIDNVGCRIRTYFTFIGYCGFYYSFVLQAMFRLFRVVFYRRKDLQSRHFFIIAISFQWLLASVLPLANLLPGDYEYLAGQYKCWFSFENVRGLLVALLLVYTIPIVSIIIMYIRILRYVRQNNHIQQRSEGNKRDVLVLQRIVVLLMFTVAVGLPTAIILFIYIISRVVISYAYQIQEIALSISLLASPICSAFISAEIKKMISALRNKVRPHNIQMQNKTVFTMPVVQT